MWVRVKGRTENALLALHLDSYMFRPGFIQPVHGVKSRTRLYRAMYAVTAALYPVLRRVAPKFVTTSETVVMATSAGCWPASIERAAVIRPASIGSGLSTTRRSDAPSGYMMPTR